ncbi:endonuclease/exonuclease/phosphatase family protein [Rhodococcus erythropolis]|uniref:endonuclease/exonuclease/phosphatase family protein n=1 Tax=Rhodococcus erythropolis TaxID=1833 RepID=UPI001BEC8026|nr:endonuclease/exonuclease/phosphatase family protein [Rhodococcus erythropolis]MBT2269017.1 endonuclease/exonuclease/phosphatase family protein [Rhodococcus erythropolis]
MVNRGVVSSFALNGIQMPHQILDFTSHTAAVSEIDLFHQVRVKAPDSSRLTSEGTLGPKTDALQRRKQKYIRAGAWNVERCKYPGAVARKLEESGCDLGLLTEIDIGMARSGNIDTIDEVARTLGWWSAVSIEFIELGAGNQAECAQFADEPNQQGLHGNAVVSRWPIIDAWMVRPPASGIWVGLDWHSSRIGSRHALLCLIEIDGHQLCVAAVHVESESDPVARGVFIDDVMNDRRLKEYSSAVVGGDLNSAGLPPPEGTPDTGWFTHPDEYEPSFASMRSAGFTWARSNIASATRRTLASGWPKPPFRRDDWLLSKGLEPSDPVDYPALNSAGFPVSDHELVTCRFAL